MRNLLPFAAALATTALGFATPAFAAVPPPQKFGDPIQLGDDISLDPIINGRLRWENVEQTGKADEANAVTLRIRAGFELNLPDKFSLLAEATGTVALDNNYFNGTPNSGRPTALYPTVSDPQTIGLNRLQMQYKGLTGVVLTVGRQRINLDDQRFVGSVDWRDNEQTFDALRVEVTPIKNLKADLTYAWKDNTIFGMDGQFNAKGPITGHIGGDNVFGTLGYTTPIGTIEGFGYVVNQDTPLRVQFSSQTFGGRFSGKYAFDKQTSLSYTLSYATESDVKLNPVAFSADYYFGEVTLTSHGFSVGGGYEVLGADTSAHTKATGALTTAGFQMPLATLHKWNGWADIFLTTPPTGLTDAYGMIAYKFTQIKALPGLDATVIYHQFNSDTGNIDYGHEWDASVGFKLARGVNLLAKYADYTAHSFGVNTRKFWLQLEFSY